MPDNLQPVNIGSIARGAALELFEVNIEKIAQNIADPTTPARGKRKLVLTFTFEPDADRQAVEITTTSEVRLAAVAKHSSRAWMGKDRANHPYIFPVDPRQAALFEPPAPESQVLEFGRPKQQG